MLSFKIQPTTTFINLSFSIIINASLTCLVSSSPALAAALGYVSFVSGNTATIDSGSGTEILTVGREIDLGDIIKTNSDRVEFSYNSSIDSGYARMGIGSLVSFVAPPSPLTTGTPELDWVANFTEGEVLFVSEGLEDVAVASHWKYRTSCHGGKRFCETSSVFLRPGTEENVDQYFALDCPIEVYDFQPITSSDPNDWSLLLSLAPGQTASLTLGGDGFHSASTPQNISDDDLLYIQQNYINNSQWTSVPEPTSTLSLLAFGTLGAASTLKRKLKPSKSTTKETTKVG
jgi:hypothetical protein